MDKKLVVVCGATGQQGGSVVRELIEHGGYFIRGLTRDLRSSSSQDLAMKGVQMVHAASNDKESLVKAFEGAYAVFGMTVSYTEDNETELGRNMVDACKANNVPLFVWSTLPSAVETSNGKHHVQGFDEKAEVDKYIAASGQPSVILGTGGFAENLPRQLKQDETDPSNWHILYPFASPDLPLSCTWVEKDVGSAVFAVIEKWEDPHWRQALTRDVIPLCSYRITGKEMAETLHRVTGKNTDFVTVDTAYPPIIPLYKWQADGYYTYPGNIPPDILVKAGAKFHTFEEYVKEKVVPIMSKTD